MDWNMISSWRLQLQGPSPSGDLVSENIPIIYYQVLWKAKDTHHLPTHMLLDTVMKCIYVEICARILHKVIFCKAIDLTWALPESKGSSHWGVQVIEMFSTFNFLFHLRRGHEKRVLKNYSKAQGWLQTVLLVPSFPSIPANLHYNKKLL